MDKKSYEKLAINIDEQLNLLESRGMDLGDKEQAYKFLQSNNYYRFSTYSYPFREINKDGSLSNNFERGTNFVTVVKLYRFDHQLRHQVFKGIASIELTIRTHFAYQIGMQCGAHAHLTKDFFNDQNKEGEILEKLKKSIKKIT